MIGDERQAQLEPFLDQLQKKTGVQFAVLTVASTRAGGAERVQDARVQVVGHRQRRNAMTACCCWSRWSSTRCASKPGYGLEGTLPDGWQSRMVRDLVLLALPGRPARGGITAAVLACAQRIGAEKHVALEWNGKELRYDREKPLAVDAVPPAAPLLPGVLRDPARDRLEPRPAQPRRLGRLVRRGGFGGGGLGGWGGGFGGGAGRVRRRWRLLVRRPSAAVPAVEAGAAASVETRRRRSRILRWRCVARRSKARGSR